MMWARFKYRRSILFGCWPFWLAVCCMLVPTPVLADEVELHGRRFQIPQGFTLQIVAEPPLVERPICSDFDENGFLYVAESSGSNDDVQTQLAEKPHRILRLQDIDGDGRFDERTIFADRMMFPEGVLWHAGSIYVTAPPEIWKLTDADGDGIAEQREVWFDGQTLTGCANDLHGPFLGRDGWIYWCKGAFAEQTHQLTDGSTWTTRAAHIFRRRPEGGPIEPVMTGGMDNPVEVVFTPSGERIFTTTFFQHPAGGQRDGLVHAIHGGVYGKKHGVIDGHPRTGDVMPVLTHLGAAAPCGLTLLESDACGEGFQGNLLATLFNMHKVTRHVLEPSGATYITRDSDLLVCDDLDFHPTDVLEDADGSIVVIDTGGWYKLCCPTSHFWKPDIPGAIYRLRREDAPGIDDPWGQQIAWSELVPTDLARLLGDSRPRVRQRALAQLAERGAAAVKALSTTLQAEDSEETRGRAVWSLCRIDHPRARTAVRAALKDRAPQVRQAALHAASVWRDRKALPALLDILESEQDPHVLRAAAETLGRLRDPSAVPAILKAASAATDRTLEHSLTFALIEIGDPSSVRHGLQAEATGTRRAALIALDQMPAGELAPELAFAWLDAPEAAVREAARWVVLRHPEWGRHAIPYFRQYLERAFDDGPSSGEFLDLLRHFAADAEVQQFLSRLFSEQGHEEKQVAIVLEALADAELKRIPQAWIDGLAIFIRSAHGDSLKMALRCLRSWPLDGLQTGALQKTLATLAREDHIADETRLGILAALTRVGQRTLHASQFGFLLSQLHPDNSVAARALVLEAWEHAELSTQQKSELLALLPEAGPLELEKLVALVVERPDESVTRELFATLPAIAEQGALPASRLRELLAPLGETWHEEVDAACRLVEANTIERRQRLVKLSSQLPTGDSRRGQRVFHGPRAACASCHAIGYLGGRVGPDLTHIGRIRTELDLLESLLFPSASFVRSFEPVSVVTLEGEVIHGIPRREDVEEIVLTVDAQREVRVSRANIESMAPGRVSVMPAGLDRQLSPQELADLLAFLKASQ